MAYDLGSGDLNNSGWDDRGVGFGEGGGGLLFVQCVSKSN